MLSPRENLLRVLRHEMPEWIPICGHCDPYNQPHRDGMDPALAEKLGTVRWGDESTVHFSRALGLDIMDWFSGPPIRSRGDGVEVERTLEGDDAIHVWHTPRGDLREVVRRARADGTSYRVEHLLKGPDDLPALASAFEDESFEADPERAAELAQRRTLIGEDGLIAFPMPSTPLGMLVRVYAGVATTAFLCHDAPDALRDLFAVMGENYLRRARLAATFEEADVLITVDDTSTTTVSPALFECYCLDYTNRAAEVCHAAGKSYFHHSCGLIRDLLDLYRRTKMDAVHAFTVPPIGDVTVREGKTRLGPDIVIFAGLTQLFGSLDDWDAVAASVRDMFEGAAPGDNFILGLAADPEKTMADTRRLLDECRKYQTLSGS